MRIEQNGYFATIVIFKKVPICKPFQIPTKLYWFETSFYALFLHDYAEIGLLIENSFAKIGAKEHISICEQKKETEYGEQN